MDIVDPRIEAYMAERLRRFDEPVLLEMEAEAVRRGFPIVGRNVGVTLEVLARSVGARRVMELGSGFGYSAYWFARAVGPGGEVHCTDGDPANAEAGASFLARAGLGDRVTYHVGDAVEQLSLLDGPFDVVFCDIDKTGYPDAWRFDFASGPQQAGMLIGKCCPVQSGRWIADWALKALHGEPGDSGEEIGLREYKTDCTLDYKRWPQEISQFNYCS